MLPRELIYPNFVTREIHLPSHVAKGPVTFMGNNISPPMVCLKMIPFPVWWHMLYLGSLNPSIQQFVIRTPRAARWQQQNHLWCKKSKDRVPVDFSVVSGPQVIRWEVCHPFFRRVLSGSGTGKCRDQMWISAEWRACRYDIKWYHPSEWLIFSGLFVSWEKWQLHIDWNFPSIGIWFFHRKPWSTWTNDFNEGFDIAQGIWNP